jgi:hypothetical protein
VANATRVAKALALGAELTEPGSFAFWAIIDFGIISFAPHMPAMRSNGIGAGFQLRASLRRSSGGAAKEPLDKGLSVKSAYCDAYRE